MIGEEQIVEATTRFLEISRAVGIRHYEGQGDTATDEDYRTWLAMVEAFRIEPDALAEWAKHFGVLALEVCPDVSDLADVATTMRSAVGNAFMIGVQAARVALAEDEFGASA